MENDGKNPKSGIKSDVIEGVGAPPFSPTHVESPRATHKNQPENNGLLPLDAENRPIMPISASQASILRAFGFEDLLNAVGSGMTYTAISEMIGVSPTALSFFIHNLPKTERDALKRAKQESAELIVDKAGEEIYAPNIAVVEERDEEGGVISTKEVERPLTAADVAYRKLKADYHLRRAAQRNSSYRDKAPVDPDEAQSTQSAPSFTFSIRVVGGDSGGKPVIEGELVQDGE